MQSEQLQSLLERKGVDARVSGPDVKICCPFCCEVKYKCYLTPSKGLYHCFRCGVAGRLRSLLRSIGIELWIPKSSPLGQTSARIHEKLSGKLANKTDKSPSPLPKEFIPLWEGQDKESARMMLNRLEKRGVTREDVLEYRLGYCVAGRYAGHIIFPIQDLDGNIVSFQSRRVFSSTAAKTLNPSRDEVGGAPKYIYNLHRAIGMKRLVICEGPFDAIWTHKLGQPPWSLGIGAAGIMGVSATTSQLALLWAGEWDCVYVALDPDALEQAHSLARELVQFLGQTGVRLVRLDRDPDEYELGDLAQALEQAEVADFGLQLRWRLGIR